jgi:hypothetical protein
VLACGTIELLRLKPEKCRALANKEGANLGRPQTCNFCYRSRTISRLETEGATRQNSMLRRTANYLNQQSKQDDSFQ